MLQLFNNLTRTKEEFVPLNPKKVGMYVCGVTVYDYCHIGHGRTYVAFDLLNRYLRHLGYAVTYVRNVTDIDDKIIKRANEQGRDFNEVTTEFLEVMHEDFASLGILKPDLEPMATQSIDSIIDMIKALIDKDRAYQGDNGDVYFAVNQFPSYGALSKQNIEDLRSGERIEVAGDKRDPLDFVLWKKAKANEPSWPSPWGNGRPGWHIECSAMSKDCLGAHFDIHGGGSDLQFPHHENEIAQSEAANDQKFVNYWLHTGMVQVEQEKMSKSLGNFFTIRDVLKLYRAESVRFFLISSHYRSQLNYSEQNLDSADASLERLYLALSESSPEQGNVLKEYVDSFEKAMNDDLNSPEALSVLFDLARQINRAQKDKDHKQHDYAATLKALGALMGILQQEPMTFLRSSVGGSDEEGVDEARIEALIAERIQAKKDKNFARSDEIRDQLLAEGILLEDSHEGTRWRRV